MTLTSLQLLYTAAFFFILGLVVLWAAIGYEARAEQLLERARATREETERLAETVGLRMRLETRRRAGD